MHVFFDKRRKSFNIMKFQKNLVISSKKINSNLVYNKKYLKINTKESFQCFYAPVILIDSIYRKDENYYLKVLLENNNFNDCIGIYSDDKYSDDTNEKIKMNKIKCIDLYLEKTS